MSTLFELALTTALKGLLFLLVVWGVASCLARASAATRHLVWTAGVVGILVLPALQLLLPGWRVAVAPAWVQKTLIPAPPLPPNPVDARRPFLEPTVAWGSLEESHAAPAPVAAHPPIGLPAGILAAWAAGALFTLGLLALQHARVRRLAARYPAFDDPAVRGLVRSAARSLGIARPIRVLQGPATAVPMTWGVLRPVLLLPETVRDWPPARVRDVLIHELTHLRRRDAVIQVLSQIVCALYWWNPLVWLAARRLRVERELACDDAVLAAGASAADYAETLVSVARAVRPLPGAAMAFVGAPQLPGRLTALLDESRRRGPASVGGWVAVLAASLLVVPMAALDLAAALPEDTDSSRSTKTFTAEDAHGTAGKYSISHVNGTWTGSWEEDGERGKLRAEGEITFNESFTDIVAISPGGSFKVEEQARGTKRKLEIRPEKGGALVRTYWRNGESLPYDAEAAAWFTELLPAWFRRSGAFATERVAWILKQKGAPGVLDEIALIESDFGARQYMEAFLAQAPPEQVDVGRLLELARDGISSDFELSTVLSAIAEFRKLGEAEQLVYVEACTTIDSDFEQRRALSAFVENQSLSGPVLKPLLAAAGGLSSDYEQAEFLIQALEVLPREAAIQEQVLAAVATIGSDYEQRRVLSEFLERSTLSPAALAVLLDTAGSIDGDYELAELLVGVSERYPIEGEVAPPFFAAAATVGGDYEQSRVLDAVVSARTVPPETLLAVLRTAGGGIGSNHELAELLVGIARAYPLTGELRKAYIETADALGSGYDAERALAALARNEAR